MVPRRIWKIPTPFPPYTYTTLLWFASDFVRIGLPEYRPQLFAVWPGRGVAAGGARSVRFGPYILLAQELHCAGADQRSNNPE